MSQNGKTQPGSKAPERPKYGPPTGTGGPRMFGPQAGTGEKSLNFLPSFKRLLGHLAPELRVLAGVLGLALTGIAMNVTGPLLLGRATDESSPGDRQELSRRSTKEQVVAQLRAEGDMTYAAWSSGWTGAAGHRLRPPGQPC